MVCFKHGASGSRAHRAWLAMRSRCYKENNPDYPRYGGRGITVCTLWLNDFGAFKDHVSQLPHYNERGRSLDRIDNDGHYEPGNVRWSTRQEQAWNRETYMPSYVPPKKQHLIPIFTALFSDSKEAK